MKGSTLEALESALTFKSAITGAHRTFDNLLTNQGLNLTEWLWVQPLLMDTLSAAQALQGSPVYDRSWVSSQSAPLFTVMASLWAKYVHVSIDPDPQMKTEFADLMVCAIEVMGLPTGHYDFGLLGVTPELNQAIVDETIICKLPAEGFSIEGKHEQFESAQVQHQRQFELLVSKLLHAGAINPLLDVLEAMSLLHSSNPDVWQVDALLETSIHMFKIPLEMDEAQKQRAAIFFDEILDSVKNFEPMRFWIERMINMGRSGLGMQAQRLISKAMPHLNDFNYISSTSLLASIEKYVEVDVQPWLNKWAENYNQGGGSENFLLAVLGYQLLTTKTAIPADQLKFKDDDDYLAILMIIKNGGASLYERGEFQINQDNLKDLVAEMAAQRPRSIARMAKAEELADIVTELPAYYVDRLETDLGL
jgi:hypothetical protein